MANVHLYMWRRRLYCGSGADAYGRLPRLPLFFVCPKTWFRHVDPAVVEEVFFGNVLTANLGKAPAIQAALELGFPIQLSAPLSTKSVLQE